MTGGSITTTNANTIDGLTTGVVTASISQTDAATLATVTDANGNNDYTATITTASVDASVFNGISTVIANLTDGGVTTLTEDSADFAEVNTALTSGVLAGDEAVNITGDITATNVSTILNNTSGVVTATVSSDSAANLNSNLTNTSGNDALTLTVTNTPTDAADLVALNGKTNQQINLSAVTVISGDASELTNIYDTNVSEYNGLGNENITIDDTVSISDATTIAGYTSEDTNITLSAASVDATDITTLNTANGNGTIDGSNLTAINGSVSEINAALSDLDTNPANFDSTLSAGTETANAITTLNTTNGTGTVDASGITGVTGTSTEIEALQDAGITMDADYNATITGTAATNDVESIFADTSGVIDATFGISDDTLNINFDELDSSDILDFGNGDDTLAFDTAVSGDLDFSNISNLENLNLSSGNDNISLSGDEPTNVNGEAGDDTFALNFSNIDNFNIDGGSNTDNVELTGNSNSISSDTEFGHASSFTNIEKLDIRTLNLDTADTGTEFEFTDALIQSWTGSSTGNLTLSLTSTQADLIKFTDTSSSTERNSYNSGNTNSDISDNTTYNLGNTTLTIDLTDV